MKRINFWRISTIILTTGFILGASAPKIFDSIIVKGSLGTTAQRAVKGWFIDLEVTNAIAGSVTGNAGTVSTITGLAPDTATTQATQPNITTATSLVIDSDQVEQPEIGTATYDDVQDWSDTTQSSGIIDGGVISDAGAGTVDVTAVKGVIKSTNIDIGANFYFDLTGLTGQALADNDTNYIAVDYNAGTPQFVVGITDTSNGQTIFNVGKVYREGTSVDILSSGTMIFNLTKRVQQHHIDEASLHFTSGAVVSEPANLKIAMTAGVMYSGLNRITTDAIDTNVADTFEYYYNDGAWQESDQTDIDNLQYNNFGVGLATLSNNQYGVHWVYKGTGTSSYVVYGIGSYTLVQAQALQPPSSLPEHIQNFGVLRARVIIAKSAAGITEIDSVDDTQFTGSTASNHNELGGLQGGAANDYYHWTTANQDLLLTSTRGDIWYSSATDTLSKLAIGANTFVLTSDGTDVAWAASASGFADPMTTRGDIIYRDATNTTVRLPVGANTFVLTSDGTDTAWAAPTGGGDVSKVGTPVDNQVGVWTGDGTIEGTTGLTYDGSNFHITGDLGITGTRITKGWFTDLQATNAIAGSVTGNAGTVSTITGLAPDTATTQATQASITSAANLVTTGTITTGGMSTGAVLGPVTMTLGADADGDIYYRSTNVLTRLAKGTALYGLRMNAGATAPEWAAISSGLDIDGLTPETVPAQNDNIPFYDETAAANRKATIGNLRKDLPNDQTGTTYTLGLTDAGKTVFMNNAASNVLTIPTNASIAFETEVTIAVIQEGAGSTTITAAGGVTLNGVSAGSIEIGSQYGIYMLEKRGTNAWFAFGGVQTNNGWTAMNDFTRASDSTFTVTDNTTNQSIYRIGRPIRYADTVGTWSYGYVTDYTTGTVTIAGAPMTTSFDAFLDYGDMAKRITIIVKIAGTWADGVDTDLLWNDMDFNLKWDGGEAYIVSFNATQKTVDTGAEGKLNILAGGAVVSTNDTNLGLQLGASRTTVKNSAVAINTTNYLLSLDEEIELNATAGGGTGDGADLSVAIIIIER